ncbi:MAG: AMIN domain-containing protein, partial [Candidatus Acidiferrales bacterium]
MGQRAADTKPFLAWFGITSILVLACLTSVSAQSRTQKIAQAGEQFAKAEKMRTALTGKAAEQRTAAEYKELALAFRRVYLITPHAAESSQGLLAVAETYHEMGRLFDERYHHQAIDAYLFLLKHYPATRYRDDALFTVAHIQYEDLGELDSAEQSYREFLRRFPRAPKAGEAQAALARIARDRVAAKSEAARTEIAAARAAENRLPQVTRINHWNNPNYTRVVISLEGAAKFQSGRITNPDRIYFDLYTAKLSSTLAGKTLEVGGGFLKAIRVAQNQAGVVRVVLDLEKVKDYSAFMLPDPYRLVVDVYGEGASQSLAKADITPLPPATDKSESERASSRAGKPAAAEGQVVDAAAKASKGARGKSDAGAKEVAGSAAVAAQPTRNGGITLGRAMGLKIGRIVIDAGHGGH